MQVITGPNMGGKSTYMRQVAIIVLLAVHGLATCRPQPAGSGPIDAIHTRIGAADDLANAQSTFMLEMTEAAQILHGATAAFAGADGRDRPRHLHLRWPGAGRPASRRTCTTSTQAFTLFATHYFELTEFPATHHGAVNVHVSAAEAGRRHRVPARDPARPGQPQLRHPGGAAGRHARRRGQPCAPGAGSAGSQQTPAARPGRPVRAAARSAEAPQAQRRRSRAGRARPRRDEPARSARSALPH